MARPQSNHRRQGAAAPTPLIATLPDTKLAIETQALQGIQVTPNLPQLPIGALAPYPRPAYYFDTKIQNGVGAQTNPFHWIVNVAGYPLVNVVVQFRGAANKDYQVQLRHHHPSMYAMTCTYVIERKTGTLPQGGFALVEFVGVRPRLADLDIIAFSGQGSDFASVAATVYATSA